MKRIGANLLAILAAVIFPLLIWVGLFVAISPRLARAAKRVSGLTIVFLAGVFAPVLIWVGLFIAIKERFQEWELKRSPARTISEIMAAAGLDIQGVHIIEEAPSDAIFTPRPLHEIHGIFARAGI